MRRIYYILATLIGMFSFWSCESKKKTVTIDQIQTITIEDNDTVISTPLVVSYDTLVDTYTLSNTKVTVEEMFVLPVIEGDPSVQVIVSNKVVDYFEMLLLSEKSNTKINAKERMIKSLSKHKASMKEDFEGSLTMSEQRWFGIYESQVKYDGNTYMMLNLKYSNYYGGAHGMHGTKYIILNRKSLRELDANQLFKDKKAAKHVVEKYFNSYLKHNEIRREDLFLENGEYYLTDNFTVRNDSLIINHHVYEIAPYYLGEIEFGVPLQELKPYLKVDFGL